jgi:predicted nucleic acid-binding protein
VGLDQLPQQLSMGPALLIRHPMHQFWPGGHNVLNQRGIDVYRLLEAGQITDTYLLALAVHHGGLLVSFDHRRWPEAR